MTSQRACKSKGGAGRGGAITYLFDIDNFQLIKYDTQRSEVTERSPGEMSTT